MIRFDQAFVLATLFAFAILPSQRAEAQFFGTGPSKPVANQTHAPAIAEKASPCGLLIEGAVTKGSFTVWTEPNDPKPGEKYKIWIEIKLPKDLERFPRCDLSGTVTGTDGYKDFFGGSNEPGSLPVTNQKVRYHALTVPGAATLVKDVIRIQSKLLDEEQQVELKF